MVLKKRVNKPIDKNKIMGIIKNKREDWLSLEQTAWKERWFATNIKVIFKQNNAVANSYRKSDGFFYYFLA